MIRAYACREKGGPLSTFNYKPKPLGPHDIHLKITHCGICHSDIHLIDNDWEFSTYPLVPGHEIVGIIEACGPQSEHTIGDRVGIGWQAKSCFHCEWCLKGDENLCIEQEATCVPENWGGFADQVVTDGRFAFALPEQLPSPHAAPLLCGGATVFSPFVEHEINARMRVAVIGIGGLGHIALQIAHAHGCELTAISSSPDKSEEAKRFGADHFAEIKDLDDHKNTYDVILCTSSHGINWELTVGALRPRGKLCLMGVPIEPLALPIMMLIDGRKVVCGSNIGSRPVINQMLAFCDRHKIRPMIEEFPMKKIHSALDKIRSGEIRYRAVLFN